MSVLARIAHCFRAHAERVAVAGPAPVTYSGLAGLAAGAQLAIGARRGRAIGILAQKTPEAYGALLGALFSGNHFVPLNPKLPVERLRKICALAEVDLILADPPSRGVADALRGAGTEIVELRGAAGIPELRQTDGLAYVMFTSGSTGEPKGVMITHANLDCVLKHVTGFCEATTEDRFSQLFDASFDLSLGEILWCFSAGASLCPLDSLNVALLPAFLERERISIFGCTPSVLQKLMQAGVLTARRYASIRFSLFCGEKLSERLASEWRAVAPQSTIENLYGPTEATLYVSRHTWRGGTMSIGRPFAGCEIEVVDERLAKLAAGEVGEIVIRGPQLSPGYLRDEAQTARSFVALPWYEGGDNRWYRTGDLASKNAQGELTFIGRRDSQVKILGQRLELGEVEALLTAALPSESWLVFPTGADTYGSFEALLAVTTMGSYAAARAAVESVALPRRLLPGRLYRLAEFPLTPAGKLDRVAVAELLRAGKLEELRE